MSPSESQTRGLADQPVEPERENEHTSRSNKEEEEEEEGGTKEKREGYDEDEDEDEFGLAAGRTTEATGRYATTKGPAESVTTVMRALARRDMQGDGIEHREEVLPAFSPAQSWMCCGAVTLQEEIDLEHICLEAEKVRVQSSS